MENINKYKAPLLLLVFMIVAYNMAGGGEYTFSLSYTLEILKKYTSLIQAIIATAALILSIYVFWQQKKATQRQVKLALFDKRYEIYISVKEIIGNLINMEYPEKGVDKKQTFFKYLEYNENGSENIKEYEDTILDKLPTIYLLDQDGMKIIAGIKHDMFLYINKVCEHEDIDQKSVSDAEIKLKNALEQLREYLKKYLDYSKI